MARRKESRALLCRVVLCVVCVRCSSRARVYFLCRFELRFPHTSKTRLDGSSQTAAFSSKRDDDDIIVVIIGEEETRTLLRKRVARFGEIVGMLRVHATDGIARANAMVRQLFFSSSSLNFLKISFT